MNDHKDRAQAKKNPRKLWTKDPAASRVAFWLAHDFSVLQNLDRLTVSIDLQKYLENCKFSYVYQRNEANLLLSPDSVQEQIQAFV